MGHLVMLTGIKFISNFLFKRVVIYVFELSGSAATATGGAAFHAFAADYLQELFLR